MPLLGRGRSIASAVIRADRARETGDWAVAARLYRTALDRYPRNAPIWVQYGHALKESGEPAEAETSADGQYCFEAPTVSLVCRPYAGAGDACVSDSSSSAYKPCVPGAVCRQTSVPDGVRTNHWLKNEPGLLLPVQLKVVD